MNDTKAERVVRIHIDREALRSPTPTSALALHELGGLPRHRDLFREVGGDAEDQLIPRDGAVVELNEDDHFYSQKVASIIINGQEKEVTDPQITFEQVVRLAFPQVAPGNNTLFTVVYRERKNWAGRVPLRRFDPRQRRNGV